MYNDSVRKKVILFIKIFLNKIQSIIFAAFLDVSAFYAGMKTR